MNLPIFVSAFSSLFLHSLECKTGETNNKADFTTFAQNQFQFRNEARHFANNGSETGFGIDVLINECMLVPNYSMHTHSCLTATPKCLLTNSYSLTHTQNSGPCNSFSLFRPL